ncbi:MAG TPA: acyl carrier protein [Clostridiales bacterium]|nr:acyl carrier protein [Clostridiales bacterium]
MELEKIQDIISEVLNIEKGSITEDTKFVDDLGADSLDIFQIVMGIEEELNIEIDNEEIEKIATVGDVIEEIKRIV